MKLDIFKNRTIMLDINVNLEGVILIMLVLMIGILIGFAI
jgi:hypothetical protein